jgi:AraC-like DNA-binding protein
MTSLAVKLYSINVLIMRLSFEDFEILRQVKELLEKEYKYHHTYNHLACRFHISQTKLKIGFVTLFHKPIYEYLVSIRIEKAKWLLENTDDPIKTVAAKVGYNSRNLQKQFRKLTNMAPIEWRKQYSSMKYLISEFNF